jgi:hypothetical protein
MKPGLGDRGEERVADLIGEMGRERLALRAKGAAIALLRISAFLCLIPAFASLAGCVIPYAPGPSAIMISASIAGFAVSVLEDRRS